MPSILYSTTCYIKEDFYRLRIYIDDTDDSCERVSTQDVQFESNSLEFTSTHIPVDHIKPSYTRLNFQSLNERNNNNNNIPETIILNHLLIAQQRISVNRKSNKNLRTSSLETSNKITHPIITPTSEESLEKTRMELSSNHSKVPFKRRNFSFRQFFSSVSNSDSETSSLFKTLIKIKYIDVSNSTRWNIKSLELEMDSEDVADELYSNLNLCLSTLKQRPHRLLTFVNPLSGKGRAQSVYNKKVLPIFQEANVIVDTIYTEHANHAQKYIINETMDNYDGLVCVGGDGMFAELCHGLLLRTAHGQQLNIDNPRVNLCRPLMRIGVIPAGSTDALVFGTTGLNDPITSALQIIIGESLSIDITTVHNENGFVRFMATMLAYGFFGDIIRQSENWRCLGPLRYDLAGFCQFLRHTSYQSELMITLSSNDSFEVSQSHRIPSTKTENESTSVSLDCQQLIKNSNSISSEINSSNAIDQLIKPSIDFCRRNCDKCGEAEEFNSNENSSSLQIKLQGRYTTINCLNMPCRCAKSKYGMSPFVHLGDGSFDLILVKRSWRTNFLRFLWQVANDGRSIEDLPNVERYRVREVLIRPINDSNVQSGNWACDGELINGNEIQIRVHRQALNLFASGIQFKEKTRNRNNTIETKNCFRCFKFKKSKFSQESKF